MTSTRMFIALEEAILGARAEGTKDLDLDRGLPPKKCSLYEQCPGSVLV